MVMKITLLHFFLGMIGILTIILSAFDFLLCISAILMGSNRSSDALVSSSLDERCEENVLSISLFVCIL